MRDSFDVISELVASNPEIDHIVVLIYTEGQNWLSINSSAQGTDVDSAMAGLRQDGFERKTYPISRLKASADQLEDLAKNLDIGRLLGIVSKVGLRDGNTAHIPMMDFKCPPSEANKQRLIILLENLCLGRGYILESGRSYHYFGSQLLDDLRWREFLGKCLLMAGLSDDRYIGHQLVDGHCVLRLSAGNLKNKVPTLVAELKGF